jgi:hypothetical protein
LVHEFVTQIFLPRFLELQQGGESHRGFVAAEDLWEVLPEIVLPLAEALAEMPDLAQKNDAATLLPMVYLTDPDRATALADELMKVDDDDFQWYVGSRLEAGRKEASERSPYRLAGDR